MPIISADFSADIISSMNYTFHNRDVVLEFSGNSGLATVLATNGPEAVRRVREIFGHMREETVRAGLTGEFLVQFKVAFGYRLALFHSIERVSRRIRTPQSYEQARYLDRYIVASLAQATGKPEFLSRPELAEELESLRKAAVVAREVAGILQFVDWDIAIGNYLELNSKAGHKSRVVRTRTAKPAGASRKQLAKREATSSRRLRRHVRKEV